MDSFSCSWLHDQDMFIHIAQLKTMWHALKKWAQEQKWAVITGIITYL